MTGNVAGRVGTTSAIKEKNVFETLAFSNETYWIRIVLVYKVRIRSGFFIFGLSDRMSCRVKVKIS